MWENRLEVCGRRSRKISFRVVVEVLVEDVVVWNRMVVERSEYY